MITIRDFYCKLHLRAAPRVDARQSVSNLLYPKEGLHNSASCSSRDIFWGIFSCEGRAINIDPTLALRELQLAEVKWRHSHSSWAFL